MDLHPLNKALGAKEHILAVNRNYISQPRLSKLIFFGEADDCQY